jgi:hypothetical protein
MSDQPIDFDRIPRNETKNLVVFYAKHLFPDMQIDPVALAASGGKTAFIPQIPGPLPLSMAQRLVDAGFLPIDGIQKPSGSDGEGIILCLKLEKTLLMSLATMGDANGV